MQYFPAAVVVFVFAFAFAFAVAVAVAFAVAVAVAFAVAVAVAFAVASVFRRHPERSEGPLYFAFIFALAKPRQQSTAPKSFVRRGGTCLY
jgi:predicted lysophospholipase L1 biosynthesis ABC-type transport system permease subunit